MVNTTMRSDLSQIPLTLSAQITARQFSARQSSPEKARQVYQNTLAVWAVNTYLQYLGWATSLKTSDSWDMRMQILLNIADLELPNHGKLECLSVLPGDKMAIVAEEVRDERIAYIIVEIAESLKTARLRGFVSKISSSTIPLNSLDAISILPEYLETYHHHLASTKQLLPKLSNWFAKKSEFGWQNLDDLLFPQTGMVFRVASSTSNFRTGVFNRSSPAIETRKTPHKEVSRVKIWDLETEEERVRIALVINLISVDYEELEISVKVCPTDENAYLPQSLTIQILDETQQPVLQAKTKSTNENIEFFLSGETGEFFSIRAILNDEIKTESFMI